MEQDDQDELELLKETPGFKDVVKAVLKSQMRHLVKQLSKYGDEEAVVLTASISDGSFHHLGSAKTKGFLDDHGEIKSKFLDHCLRNDSRLKSDQNEAVKEKDSKSEKTGKLKDDVNMSRDDSITRKQTDSSPPPVSMIQICNRSQEDTLSESGRIVPSVHESEHQVTVKSEGEPNTAQGKSAALVSKPRLKTLMIPTQVEVSSVPVGTNRAGYKRTCETATSDQSVKERTGSGSESEVSDSESAESKTKKQRIANSPTVKLEVEDTYWMQNTESCDDTSSKVVSPPHVQSGSQTSIESDMFQGGSVCSSDNNCTSDSVTVKVEPCDSFGDETAMDNSEQGQFETSETENSQTKEETKSVSKSEGRIKRPSVSDAALENRKPDMPDKTEGDVVSRTGQENSRPGERTNQKNTIRKALQDASVNRRTTPAQTDSVQLANKVIQTDTESNSELLRLILDKVVEVEKKMTDMQTQITQTAPGTTTTTSTLFSNALSSINDPLNIDESDTYMASLAENTPTNGHELSTQTRMSFSTPRRQPRVTVHEVGFWKLLPCEILAVDSNSVIESARSKLPKEIVSHKVSKSKIKELEASCSNQRPLFAKNLAHNSITVGELYNRNVNGRNSIGQLKDRINPEKISYVKEQTFKVFPCQPSEVKTAWSECVRAIDKSNVYLFTVLQRKFDLSPILDYL